MRYYESSVYNAGLSAEASSAPLTADQKLALKAEIAIDPEGRGYASTSTPAEILWLLGNQYSKPSGMPLTVDRSVYSVADLKAFMVTALTPGGKDVLDEIVLLQSSANTTYARKAKMFLRALDTGVLGTLNVRQCLDLFRDQSILSTAQFRELTLVPNPDYVDSYTYDPRLWQLFGEGAIVTLDEIKEALG